VIVETAVVVVALCMVVITAVVVVALIRLNDAMERIARLATTLEAEVRPVARAVSRTADDLAEAASVVRRRVQRTDEAFDAVTHRVVRLTDRLFTPLEDVAALFHGLGVGLRHLFHPRRKEDS
jgi:uncharacterized protein YoxC